MNNDTYENRKINININISVNLDSKNLIDMQKIS